MSSGKVLELLGDKMKMPREVGFVNNFLRGSPDCPGSREAGWRAGTSMELSQICFSKPTLQGILSVSTIPNGQFPLSPKLEIFDAAVAPHQLTPKAGD